MASSILWLSNDSKLEGTIAQWLSRICSGYQIISFSLYAGMRFAATESTAFKFTIMHCAKNDTQSHTHARELRTRFPKMPLVIMYDRGQHAHAATLAEELGAIVLSRSVTESKLRHAVTQALETENDHQPDGSLGNRLRIILMHHDYRERETICAVFSDTRFQVSPCANRYEAEQVLATSVPDIVMSSPGTREDDYEGLRFLEEIRERCPRVMRLVIFDSSQIDTLLIERIIKVSTLTISGQDPIALLANLLAR